MADSLDFNTATSLKAIDLLGNDHLFKDNKNKLYVQIGNNSKSETTIPLLTKQGKPFRAPKASSPWQLVAAENFKIVFFNQLKKKARIINFDQNWIAQSNEFYGTTRENFYQLEKDFQQDFDQNGTIGKQPSIYTVVEASGNVELVKDQYRFLYAEEADNNFPVNVLKKNGSSLLISSKKQPKWIVLGAESVQGKRYLLWQNQSDGSIRSWLCDTNWKQFKASKLFKPGTSGFYELEALFQQDVDNDGSIGVSQPNFSIIENIGNTFLSQDQSKLAYIKSTDNDAEIPIFLSDGQQLSVGSDASEIQLIGAEKIENTNQVVWKNNQLGGVKTGIFDERWNLVSENKLVFSDDSEFAQLEAQFGQDFNLDKVIGERPKSFTLIEDQGSFSLFKDQSNFAYVSSDISGKKINVVDISDDAMNVGASDTEFQMIGAESFQSKNHIAMKESLTGAIKAITLDQHWQWDNASETELFYSGTDEYNQLEEQFQQDFDSDSHIGPAPKVYTTIESDGSVTLMNDQSNYAYVKVGLNASVFTVLDSNNLQVNVGSTADSISMVAAESFDNHNHIAWLNNMDKSLQLWTLDANWRKISDENDIQFGGDRFHELEQKFNTDFDVDGFVGEAPKIYSVVESIGNQTLLHDQSNIAYVRSSDEKSDPFKVLSSDGAQVNAGSSASELQFLAAETINAVNKLVLRNNSNSELKTWTLDANWRYLSETSFVAPGSSEFDSIEEDFNEDFDQNGIIGASKDFWSSEQYFNYLWGFQNKGQIFGGLSGADVEAVPTFETFGSSTSGINDFNSGYNIVAIIDTGVRYTHQDLKENILINGAEIPDDGLDNDNNGYVDDYRGYDFAYDDPDPNDVDGHGTHVAGTVAAASNGLGVIGGNPVAKILPVKVLDDNGSGSMSAIVRGINYAVQRGAKVLNMSLGGPGYSHAMEHAIQLAGEAGCLSIVAAGNENNNNDVNPVSPASFNIDSMISVGATTPTNTRASFSNYGLNTVDLYAPGQSILSAGVQDDADYNFLSGTSMATPLVSGIISSYWARNTDQDATSVKQKLMSTVKPLSFPRNTVTGGITDMSAFFSDQITSAASSNDSKPYTFAGPESLPASKSANIINEDNYNTFQKRILKSSTLIGFVSGDDEKEREESISSLERKLARKDGLYRHINTVETMEGLVDAQALLTIKNKSKIDPHEVIGKLIDDQHFDAFEIDSQFNSPLPIESDEISSSYGYRYTMTVDHGQLQAGGGDDKVSGSQSRDTIHGGDGDDSIYGFDGQDQLTGGDGHDLLYGGKGSDHLNGSSGSDQLTGNQGKDHFYMSSGVDTVTDFQLGTDHLIVDQSKFTDIKLTQQGENLLISSPGSEASLIVRDLNENDLVASDAIKFVDL